MFYFATDRMFFPYCVFLSEVEVSRIRLVIRLFQAYSNRSDESAVRPNSVRGQHRGTVPADGPPGGHGAVRTRRRAVRGGMPALLRRHTQESLQVPRRAGLCWAVRIRHGGKASSFFVLGMTLLPSQRI